MFENGLYDLYINGMCVISINVNPCDVQGLHELPINVFYNLSINYMYVLSINVRPSDVFGIHEVITNGINALYFHVCSRCFRWSGDITSEHGVHGRNFLYGLGL